MWTWWWSTCCRISTGIILRWVGMGVMLLLLLLLLMMMVMMMMLLPCGAGASGLPRVGVDDGAD
jgi:hypothetical protein